MELQEFGAGSLKCNRYAFMNYNKALLDENRNRAKCLTVIKQLIKNNDLLIIDGVIIEAALLNVTKGGPIKSFPECPSEKFRMIAPSIMAGRLAACSANYLPTSPPIDKKEFRKIRPNKFGLSVKGNRRQYVKLLSQRPISTTRT